MSAPDATAASKAHRAIDAVWRIESARLIAGMTRFVSRCRHTRAHFRPIQDVEVAKYAIDPRFKKIGIGRVNEIKATFVAHNCRQLVTLEQLHDERVNFFAKGRFTPIPREYYRAPSLLHAS